jgi:hypothetical protein
MDSAKIRFLARYGTAAHIDDAISENMYFSDALQNPLCNKDHQMKMLTPEKDANHREKYHNSLVAASENIHPDVVDTLVHHYPDTYHDLAMNKLFKLIHLNHIIKTTPADSEHHIITSSVKSRITHGQYESDE